VTRSEPGRTGAARSFLGPRLVAAFLVGLAAVLIASAAGIARGAGYSVVGPATIPLAVAIGLLVVALVFALRTTLIRDDDLAELASDEERVTDWRTVGLTAGTLLAYAIALDGIRLGDLQLPGLGFLVATALFLPIVARVLGSRSPVRDAIVGLVLAIVLYFSFTEYLGVRLPPGLLDLVS
jgi:putative tricarboxylic transport membrane protein